MFNRSKIITAALFFLFFGIGGAPAGTLGLLSIITTAGLGDCPQGDLSGDCDVDMEDLAKFAEQWLAGPGSPADFVGNDGVNTADLMVMAENWLTARVRVVINEIHYNPDLPQELVEFVELYNASSTPADISGWQFTKGISYTFPAGTTLAAGGYIVVAEDPTPAYVDVTVSSKYGIPAALVKGPFTGNLSNDGETIELSDAQGNVVDTVNYQLGFPWPTVGDAVPDDGAHPGTGRSIQLVNPAFDNDLGGNWHGAYPTPGAANSAVYAANIGPCLRQVNHVPTQPKAGQPVTITVKATDPDGVQRVTLYGQISDAGAYIARTDAAFNYASFSQPMYDDGTNGDVTAGDSVYTAIVPAEVQQNRRLVRYRIESVDGKGASVIVPYWEEACPVFAYFVYNGVPSWTGAVQPGVTAPVTYETEVTNALPVYHLISKKSDVETATWYSQYAGEEYPWYGTLVYDGVVYDCIRYRARGGVWRYAMGKNMWKFKFNRGHHFQARDDYGKLYGTLWDNLNLGACIQQGNYWHRGEQGMFEAVGFKMFNLMGVEASRTHWVQFRIIDETSEQGTTQYNGDLWGLYLTVEQPDGQLLNEHHLPNGNLYKIDGYNGVLNNQGPTQPTNGSDYTAFRSGWNSSTKPTEAWWRQNADLRRYYSYRCIVEGIHHGDIGYGKNYFFYRNPLTYIWSMHPWDLDLTWANTMFGNGQDPFINSSYGYIFGNAQLLMEYNGRLREFYDLFYNNDQLFQLIDEYAAMIDDPGGAPSFVDVDRAMWDYNPVLDPATGLTSSDKGGLGRFYAGNPSAGIVIPSPGGFRGMVQLMKDYVLSSGKAFNTYYEDPAIPAAPQIQYIGTSNYAVNDLRFSTSAFSDPQGSGTFASLKWRIAEVAPFVRSTVSITSPVWIAQNQTWRYFEGTAEPSTVTGQWRTLDYNDNPQQTNWKDGPAPIGYDESGTPVMGTTLAMRGSYTSFYLRKQITVPDVSAIGSLQFEILSDDGFNLWINGKRAAYDRVSGENLARTATASSSVEDNTYRVYTINNPANYLINGVNIIAVQVLNSSKSGSNDCFFDAMLTATYNPGSNQCSVIYGHPGKYEISSEGESGEIAPFASTILVPASLAEPGKSYRVRCKMKDTSGRWSHWSAPIQFVAGEPMAAGMVQNLRMTELMYNPSPANIAKGELNVDNNEFEFIELKNIGDAALDISRLSLADGITFSFSTGAITSLAPGNFILVVKNKAAFESRYGTTYSSRIAGQYSGKLANDGEQIRLTDYWNGDIVAFTYSDGFGWPVSADGAGHSLVPIDSAIAGEHDGSLEYGGNWRASAYINGSPGADDSEPPAGIMINEVMAHTDYSNPSYPGYDSNDWIELYNPTGSTIGYYSNWYLSDSPDNLKKWALPGGSIPAGGRISFDEITGFHSPITSGFGLDKTGEYVFLSYLPGTSADRVADYIKFGGQYNTVSWGRYPDGGACWFFLANPGTRGTANANPVQRPVVISEIMYHPTEGTTNEEYIELYNPIGATVNLYNAAGTWRLDNAVSYIFPTGKSIPAGGRIVVVPFDPAVETARLEAFNAAYGCSLIVNTTLFGPWTGDLSNSGERIAMQEPQAADPSQTPTTWWITTDQVIYGDYTPWPTSPDGTGDVLRRKSSAANASGDDPANWTASAPSPGY